MPACLTHYYFAQNVRESLEEKASLNLCAYAWGAQGPDFFFCHRFLPFWKGRSLKDYGGRLHRETPSKVLGAMRDFLKEHPDPVYRSYVWGFVCHYSLDCTAHPYVNWLAVELAKQRPWETPSTMHGEIESALDAIILRFETGKLPSEVPLKEMFPKNEPIQRKIAHLYHHVFLSLYGEDVPEELLVQAMSDAHVVFSLVTDRTGLKRKVIQRIEKGKPSSISSHLVPLTESDDVDYANLQNAPWGDGDSHQSFFELYGEAQGVAGKILGNFMDGDLSQLTEEKPFG